MFSNYRVEDSSPQIIQLFLFIMETYTEEEVYDNVQTMTIFSISIVPASAGGVPLDGLCVCMNSHSATKWNGERIKTILVVSLIKLFRFY